MKRIIALLIIAISLLNVSCTGKNGGWIRINQMGYRNNDIKVAVFLSKAEIELKSFRLIDATSGKTIRIFDNPENSGSLQPFRATYRLDFTEIKTSGTYRIEAGRIVSPDFRIAGNVYDGTADFLLNYMRQQRCGYNPFLRDSCHTRDGYEIYGRSGDSAHIDATGGWHDAADYLQYVATSANATYQMLFAFAENPGAFGDQYLANGLPGRDGVPDVLNESRWGIDWLVKMNPAPGIMYNQIADDRDHIGFRFPDKDTANYGKGKERPVYFCTGEPQGLFKYRNRATGIASTAGKFASAFAKGAEVFCSSDPDLSAALRKKAVEAFKFGLEHPGACQTAPGTAPYFYEEDNWVDDMELAAGELCKLTGDAVYRSYAAGFAEKERITPWMGSDTAKHYQWYPFMNMGHPVSAVNERGNTGAEFGKMMKEGLAAIEAKGKGNPFRIGVPFIWCSNNLVAATLTQARLYGEITGDSTFMRLEAAHRDWLFGCNPWGTSMIVGLPENGDYPVNTHSSYVVKGMQVPGGLVDGPVYPSIFGSLKYIYLSEEDEYAPFQTGMAVYHDDFADYSTNECTMDGTACLVYYLSSMDSRGKGTITGNPDVSFSKGAVVRMDSTRKEIWLCFSAHDFNDGFPSILQTLERHNVKASFFLTGDFCRSAANVKILADLKNGGHYIGPHSDRHLLYCSWENRDSLLVSREQFISDLENNLKSMEREGIPAADAGIFLPPYEWYNDSIAVWSREAGIRLVNISQGTIINQDWTYPGGAQYYSSDFLMNDLKRYESGKGMNGYILLVHPGTDPRRQDKFYFRLDSLLTYLEGKGYSFRSFNGIR